jgi:glycosyltransferase involved in cell wall biosynthesis
MRKLSNAMLIAGPIRDLPCIVLNNPAKPLEARQARNTPRAAPVDIRGTAPRQLNEVDEKMNILFVHNNFPAQFRYIVRALLRESDVALAAIASPGARSIKGVRLLKYAQPQSAVASTHPFARRFDLECRRAEEVLYNLTALATSGFVPDVIPAHPGWGETLPLRTFFPQARYVLYCECFYGSGGVQLGFDPEFPGDGLDGKVNLRVNNVATLLALTECNRSVSPTRWQRSTFPVQFQHKIDVIHEGVDIDIVKPDRHAVFRLPSGKSFTKDDEVITYAARNLEPLRGYHMFMRALPQILQKRPRAHAVIIGGEGTSYGLRPPQGTWKSVYLREVADRIDLSRVHFVGRLPYPEYVSALQISAAHVYLTYPFVLSWSLLEAMSAGCTVVASDTPPVTEVIDGENGLLVPFFEPAAIADRTIEVLANPRRFRTMREKARQLVVEKYDAERLCIPQMMTLIRGHARPEPTGEPVEPALVGPKEASSEIRNKARKRAANLTRNAVAAAPASATKSTSS